MSGSDVQRNTSCGNYILRTGQGIIGQYELVLGEFFYQRFRNCERVIDIGPGRCWFTKQNPNAITAVDNSPELVQHYSLQGIDIRLGNAYDLGLPDGFADGVFCCWVFEHLPDPLRAMREVYRVMQPGAYCMIIVPSPHDINAFYEDYTHVRPFNATSLKQLAEDSGFVRHRESFFPFAKGSMQLLRHFGPRRLLQYLNFSDKYLSKVGLANRMQAVLEAWKD